MQSSTVSGLELENAQLRQDLLAQETSVLASQTTINALSREKNTIQVELVQAQEELDEHIKRMDDLSSQVKLLQDEKRELRAKGLKHDRQLEEKCKEIAQISAQNAESKELLKKSNEVYS